MNAEIEKLQKQVIKLIQWETIRMKLRREKLLKVHLPRMLAVFAIVFGMTELVFSEGFTKWILARSMWTQVVVIGIEWVFVYFFIKLMKRWGKELERD